MANYEKQVEQEAAYPIPICIEVVIIILWATTILPFSCSRTSSQALWNGIPYFTRRKRKPSQSTLLTIGGHKIFLVNHLQIVVYYCTIHCNFHFIFVGFPSILYPLFIRDTSNHLTVNGNNIFGFNFSFTTEVRLRILRAEPQTKHKSITMAPTTKVNNKDIFNNKLAMIRQENLRHLAAHFSFHVVRGTKVADHDHAQARALCLRMCVCDIVNQ